MKGEQIQFPKTQKLISYKKEKRKLSDLRFHEFYYLLQVLETDIYEVSTYAFYDLRDTVLISEDGFIVGDGIFVEVAIKQGKEEVDVVVMVGINDDDIVRMINLKHKRFKKSKTAIVSCVQYLEDYWDRGKGADFYHEIPGSSTRDKALFLLGVSVGTYQAALKIWEFDRDLLRQVDAGEVRREYALNLANAHELKSKSKKPKGPKNLKKIGPGIIPPDSNSNLLLVFQPLRYEMFIEGYGHIQVEWIDGIPQIKINGEPFNQVNFESFDPEKGEVFHYILQMIGIGSLHLMGVDFRAAQDLIDKSKKNGNGKIDWFGK